MGLMIHSLSLLCFAVPPKWVTEPRDHVQAIQGQDVILPCLAEGFPPPTTVWTKGTGERALSLFRTKWCQFFHFSIHPGLGGSITLTSNQFLNGSLLITTASKRSEGIYTCVVDNGIKAPLRKSVNLSVNGESVKVKVVGEMEGRRKVSP